MSKEAKLLKRTAKSAYEKIHMNLENAFVALFRIVIKCQVTASGTVLKSGICKIMFAKVHVALPLKIIGKLLFRQSCMFPCWNITDTSITIIFVVLT